jgi:putative endonuclease
MTTSHAKGIRAENWGALFLMLKGYRILDMRVKTRLGEIDLVARRGDKLCFVEVKLRKTPEAAAEAIHDLNQERVRRAAELYLQKHPRYTVHDISFDALIMVPWRWPQHIVGAF